MLESKYKSGRWMITFSEAVSILTLIDVVPGSVHWQPAEFGPQSAVGRSGWVSPCFRSHADEIVSGKFAVGCLQAQVVIRSLINICAYQKTRECSTVCAIGHYCGVSLSLTCYTDILSEQPLSQKH